MVALAVLVSLAPGYYVLIGKDQSVMNILVSAVQPDFELIADPSNVTLALDGIANITIHVHSTGGFSGSVELGLTQPINSDVGPSCPALDQPKTVTPNPNAAWSFTCTSGDNQVIYTLQIKGKAATSSGPLIHTVNVTLNFKASDITYTNSFSIPLIYMISAGIGVFLISLIALTTYFAKRRPIKTPIEALQD